MMDGAADPSLTIFAMELKWDTAAGTATSAGVRMAMFWLDPSLLWMLAPLAEELGVPLFRLLVAYNANIGADDDYRGLIEGREFTEGFARWADAVAASGWGRFELADYDRRAQTARIVVHNPWELGMQRQLAVGKRWGCPFLQGKLIGLFFHGFGATCWADESAADDGSRVEFRISRSSRTIGHELAVLRAARLDVQQREVATLLARRTGELEATQRELEALVSRQQQQIMRLSTPILQVAPGTLAVPIIGVISPQRGAEMTHQLLQAIVDRRARAVVLDLTGVDEVDVQTAELFGRIVRAVQLLGAAVTICGVSPAVAQVLTDEGQGFGGARVCADMQAALAAAR